MKRKGLIKEMAEEKRPWDLLVIGGGATGLGVAVDASSRGYRVLLVEQHDFAKATSSRSTKLVHGGVRYLQQGDVSMVIEALHERGRLWRNAPHLVKDMRFIIGNYRWWEQPFYTIGLCCYDFLAGRLGLGRSLPLSKKQTLKELPGLLHDHLRGGVVYHDGQFDDSRMAITLMQSAADHGAMCINYMKVTSLLKDPSGKIRGAVLEDTLEGGTYEVNVKGVVNATGVYVDDIMQMDKPESRKKVRPSQGVHIVVDAAFLAQGLLRAPKQLWGNLDAEAKAWMITELKRSRNIKAFNNNWLLFASTVEAALLEFTGEYDKDRLLYGVEKFRDEWYKGDAMYGDGPAFHMDYYNSFVIHPMLTDVLRVMKKHGIAGAEFLDTQLKRHTRYAEILERFISPEGSFPVVGRSICYRFGAFHALGQAALMHILPERVTPAQVRCALTAVIRRQLESPANFDKNGWLRVGFTGEQIDISESYINTGSVYLCAVGLLPLGLPPTDEFWSAPYTEWTNLKAWNGKRVEADHAIK